ncbi:CAP domain-containing protein [Haloferula sp. A504]|uniref:CAP domain-containing protein n=1 Tax=Haloferula sp. A504 TaxID=3373601 RepID=UPI0031C46E83|nr:CAP domain-containing protein [Verrucomicrobiaceae bacterium E54]
MKLLLLPLLLLMPVFGDQAAFLRKAEQWMASTEASKRQAAYRTWLQMGPEAMPKYETSLERARRYHQDAIDKLAAGPRNRPNPYAGHELSDDALRVERERILPLIRTDWKKEPKQIAMLRDEMATLDDLHKELERSAKVDTTDFDQAVEGHLEALFEIHRELERFDPEADSRDLDDDELREYVLEDHLEASHLEELRRRFEQTREFLAAHEAAKESNAGHGNWASGTMKTFAEILNRERLLLGLQPLRMDEKLSDAARGHSEDMARLGFFAHESPVPGKKTPWDRAKKAGFEGRGTGENIYMGSPEAQAAYDAWFASDGHRFIMHAAGPDTLGVGISGRHWTMMTGRK